VAFTYSKVKSAKCLLFTSGGLGFKTLVLLLSHSLVYVTVQDGAKHSILNGSSSLTVNDVQLGDNGTYECRADVASYGTSKLRRVQLNVLCMSPAHSLSAHSCVLNF